MKKRNFTKIFILIVISISLFSCPEPIHLPGDISGIITDAETSLPIHAAKVKLNPSNDSTITGNDGIYILKNVAPGEYDIQASKLGYYAQKEKVEVLSAEIQQVNFILDSLPLPVTPEYLDFSIDTTSLSFTISNITIDDLGYRTYPSENWITVTPKTGGISGNETVTLNVTIDTTGLPEDTLKETITLKFLGQEELPDIVINIYLNGCYDPRTNINYKIVKIGSQIWMKENLKFNSYIDGTEIPVVTSVDDWKSLTATDKACCYYDNYIPNSDKYGYLYTWAAAMNGAASSSTDPSGVQGVCPRGWHLPSSAEFVKLIQYLIDNGYGYRGSGIDIAKSLAAKSDWEISTTPGTVGNDPSGNNSSGFTALPGGTRIKDGTFVNFGFGSHWWTSTEMNKTYAWIWSIYYSVRSDAYNNSDLKKLGLSVRCLKD